MMMSQTGRTRIQAARSRALRRDADSTGKTRPSLNKVAFAEQRPIAGSVGSRDGAVLPGGGPEKLAAIWRQGQVDRRYGVRL
jgi:hypothetical protein